MKVTKVTAAGRGMYAHVCPLCGRILASASEPDLMPEFSICDCDRAVEKQPAYQLYGQEGYVMIRRTKPPRFTGRVTFGLDSDIEDIRWQDSATATDMAKALRKAGEFLLKHSRHD